MSFEDPFEDPSPRVSAFASADSFRGRLILVEPVKIEHDIPKSTAPNSPRGDRITATVTVVDGKGPVQTYSQRVPTGKFLEGDVHRGVWFNQDQLVDGLKTPDGKALRKMVLARLDTFKPGTPAGQGNPWTIAAVSDADKQTARDYLANRTVSEATGGDENPFAK